ncbi:hypothetical protein CVT23_11720 [Minwuia thermotolerans]|uniref:CHASE2 domain-containing protein n=1 Tax=Minwuia thermotolerans TaxID=2056226 RepID=A0A2M9G1V3_9PROT|nr:hypothetical protein CVT23_11720 [Minwuia thermotolerans]
MTRRSACRRGRAATSRLASRPDAPSAGPRPVSRRCAPGPGLSDAVGNSGAGRSRWLPPFATIAAGALIYLLAYDAPMLRALEGRTIDWRFQARGAATAGPEVLLVLIDDSSIASAGGWPLPRRVLADAVTALRDAGARVIALDLLLADPQGEGDMELVRRVGADDDVVVPFAFVFDGGGERAPPAVREAAVDIRQGIGAGGGRGGVVPPFPALARAAEMGHAEVIVDADNRLRFLHAAIPH